MKLISLSELKAMRIPAIIMGLLVMLFLFSGIFNYRMLDVFGTKEWEREGPPGTHSGSGHYYHK